MLLSADGRTDTYTLINRTLGGNVVETPDCSDHSFGPHIRQEFDRDLGKPSFVFYLHVTPDDDRCINSDRQRTEIKTYASSPRYLKGLYGDTVTYRWKFKLDSAFRPSNDFTHIHQIKAGDGDDASNPVMTLTLRAGSPDQMQLNHVDSGGTTQVLAETSLAPMKGVWVEAYEKITYATNGSYSLILTRAHDGSTLFSYHGKALDMWRTGSTFLRPKWGIYRSLKHANLLRDEAVRFNDFCLANDGDDCPHIP